MPSARSFMAASVFDGSLHIFGGTVDQSTRSNELYRFKLPIQPKCTLRKDFYKLLQKELLCDLNFIIGDVKIKAHCAIVSCRSVYLRKRVKNCIDSLLINSSTSSTDQNNVPKPSFLLNDDKTIIDIQINDTNNPDAFRIVLEFIYTDCIISIEGKGLKIYFYFKSIIYFFSII